MRLQMEAMIEELETVKDIEQMAELENEIAGVLGRGFLKGRFDYSYLMQVKEQVEQIETVCRERFENEQTVQMKRNTQTR